MPVEADLVDGDRWVFDAQVADAFDDMLVRSIPQLTVMRELVFDLGKSFVKRGTDVVDLGCSRGAMLAPFVDAFTVDDENGINFVGVDVSEPMLDAAKARFAHEPARVSIYPCDLRYDFPETRASLVLSVLTLMFTPINYRQRIVEDVYHRLVPGGAFVLVEKLIGQSAVTDHLIQDRYHRLKTEHGYSREEIIRKAAALEGVQVPMTAAWNEDVLRWAGFRKVECFWRWCNFAGWIAIKDER